MRLALLAMVTLMLLVMFTFTCTNAIAREAPLFLVAHPDVATRWLNRDATRAIFAMRRFYRHDRHELRCAIADACRKLHGQNF